MILHIPHASTVIPSEYLGHFCLSEEKLNEELLRMTDHFTDELFFIPDHSMSCIRFPVSRLLVDPERFEADQDEPMSRVGMGCVYERTHDGKPLKNVHGIREDLIREFYRPHHEIFTNLVEKELGENQQVLIIDCHSFTKFPLPHELDQKPERAEICIGTDEFHTPTELRDRFVTIFKKLGFSVAVDQPFSGSIVPSKFWEQDKRVQSIMIEVRRDLYMDEETGTKNQNFDTFGAIIKNVLAKQGKVDHLGGRSTRRAKRCP